MGNRTARQAAQRDRELAEDLGIEGADAMPRKVLAHLIADRVAEAVGAPRPWAELGTPFPPGTRYKLGNVFRITGASVQPATLPFDDEVAPRLEVAAHPRAT